jgi:hypothetical protein
MSLLFSMAVLIQTVAESETETEADGTDRDVRAA